MTGARLLGFTAAYSFAPALGCMVVDGMNVRWWPTECGEDWRQYALWIKPLPASAGSRTSSGILRHAGDEDESSSSSSSSAAEATPPRIQFPPADAVEASILRTTSSQLGLSGLLESAPTTEQKARLANSAWWVTADSATANVWIYTFFVLVG